MAEAMKLQKGKAPSFHRKDIPAKGYTYKDYSSWGEDVRCELIDGIPYMLAAPTERHQWIAGKVYRQIDAFLDGKPCRAYIAPFDVRLFHEEDESDKTVVQPDVLVVCDRKKLSDGRSCRGAPDFVVEVVSDGSVKQDFVTKKAKYEKARVREYWVIDDEEVYKYVLSDGRYLENVYALNEELRVEVDVLSGCSISFKEIIAQALQSEE